MDLWSLLVRNAVAPLWARWEGSPYLNHYRTLCQTQFDSLDVIRARQWQAIADLVGHAYATTSFWRQRMDQAGLRPSQIRSWEDFRSLPLLTKKQLRTESADLLSSQFKDAWLQQKKTSGSTGIAVEVYVDKAAQEWKRALTLRSDEWSGWRFGERVAKVWGHPDYERRGWRKKLRNALLERVRYLDTLKIDPEALEKFAQSLRSCPPSLLFGHAHSLCLLAEFLRSQGGAGFRPRGIISTAMVLHTWQRRSIEEVFACQVTNRYGCEEVSLIACECERHEGLHINADGVYLEVLRPDGSPAAPGEVGTVVVTDLVNRAMPILRYQVGDMAMVTDRCCPCGRGLPLLERLEGRDADYVITPRGELVSGISLTDHFGTVVPGIVQLQIVQETMQDFLFRIVPGPGFQPASLEHLRGLVAERFGSEARYACDYVEQIPQEPSGKYRFCISKVAHPYTSSREAAVR
jgi:phenylacetate-CoA ligase